MKINLLRATITQRLNGRIANPLRWDRSHTGSTMDHVRNVAVEEVKKLIVSMPAKTSPLDILPTKLLKSCVDTSLTLQTCCFEKEGFRRTSNQLR